MANPEQPPGAPPPVQWRIPDIHPEGRKYVIAVAALALLSWIVWDFLTWPLILLTLLVAAFFRDPVRVTPQGEGIVVAPADGLVAAIARAPLPPELAGPHALGNAPLVRLSIAVSAFDVHINRAPVGGSVLHVIYVAGGAFGASPDRSREERQRQHFVLQDRTGLRVGFTQIAGAFAHRLVSFVKTGDLIVQGQRLGLIRFGSRVDVYLPEGYGCRVALGQSVLAGETVLAARGAGDVAGIPQ